MAIKRLPILGWPTKPDGSGDVFFEPFSIQATNDVWDRLVAVFNDTATRIGLHGGFAVPKDYVGSANLVLVWTSTAVAGNVAWDCDYRAVGGDDAESLDQAGTQESVTGTAAAPTAALNRLETSIAFTAANFSPDDEVEFTLFRDGTDAADTMAAAAILFGAFFEYADA
jgi:putative transposon-encoded protein